MFRPQSDKTAQVSAEKVALLSASSFCGNRAFGRLRPILSLPIPLGKRLLFGRIRGEVRPNGLRRGPCR